MSMRKDHHINVKIVEAKGFPKGEEIDCFIVIKKFDKTKSNEALQDDTVSMKTTSTSKTKGSRKLSGIPLTQVDKHIVGKTKIVSKSKTPWFDESFDIELSDDFNELSVEVHQHGLINNKLIGQVLIQKLSLELDYRYHEDWYTLRQPDMAAEDIEEKRIEKAHDFQQYKLNMPQHCDKCKQMIWAGGRTACKCSICSSVTHEACVKSVGLTCGSAGLIRIKYMYTEEYLLPIATYEPMLQLLCQPDFTIAKCLGRVVTEDREEVARNLITVYSEQQQAVSFLKAVVSAEIASTSDANTIFRANSLGSKSIDCFMKLVGQKYLKQVLAPVIQEILIQNRVCEVDPTRFDATDKDLVDETFTVLDAYLKWALDVILRSFKDCPYQMKMVFGHLRKEAHAKFPNDKVVGNTVVTAFIFLRFFNAAILGPQLFGLSPDGEPPNPRNARTLTLMSKTIQQLANVTPFSAAKEPHMVKLNHLVTGQYITMLNKYLDEICTPPSDSEIIKLQKKKEGGNTTLSRITSLFKGSSTDADSKPVDIERELAALYRNLMRHTEKMASDAALTADEKQQLIKLQVVLGNMLQEYLKKSSQIQAERDVEMKRMQGDGQSTMSEVSTKQPSSIYTASSLLKTNALLGIENEALKELARLEVSKNSSAKLPEM